MVCSQPMCAHVYYNITVLIRNTISNSLAGTLPQPPILLLIVPSSLPLFLWSG